MKHRLLIFIIALALAAGVAGAEKLRNFNREAVMSQEYFGYALTFHANQNAYEIDETYAGGKTILLARRGGSYNFDFCLLASSDGKRFFTGMADFSEPASPRLCYGTLILFHDKPDGNFDTSGVSVRFNYDIDLTTLITPPPIKGKYNFGRGHLAWRVEDEQIYEPDDRYKINTCTGLVKQTSGGFYAKQLYVTDHLSFGGAGAGSAIQKGTAEGREEYMASTDKYGPRGGYKGTHTSSSAVEYDVTVTRTQPMSYTLDKATGLLTLKYSSSCNPHITYKKATSHPVMTQIKGAYSRWTKAAPLRFSGTESFIYVATLPKWLVLRHPDSEVDKPESYLFVPVDGWSEEFPHPDYPFMNITLDITPKYLAAEAINIFASE